MKTNLIFKDHLVRVAMLLLVGVLEILSTTETWATSVNYINADGVLTSANATAVTSTTTTMGTAAQSSWYYISGNITIENRIEIKGTVNLILTDGCKFEAENGLHLVSGNTLNIFVQSAGTGSLSASHYGGNAAIGGNEGDEGIEHGSNGEDAGNLNIYGGVISTWGSIGGGSGGEGIGWVYTQDCWEEEDWDGGTYEVCVDIYGNGYGGNGGNGGTIHIYGGQITVGGSLGGGCPGYGSEENGDNGDADVYLSWSKQTDYIYADIFFGTHHLQSGFVDLNNREYTPGVASIPDFTKLIPSTISLYNITINNNVYLCADKTTSVSGETIKLTAWSGYIINSITVKDADNGDVDLTDNHDGTWTFVMPAKDVTVTPAATVGYTITHPAFFGIGVDSEANRTKNYYRPGATITVTLPDFGEGYRLDRFSIADGNGPLNYTQTGNTCTFTMPENRVVISGIKVVDIEGLTVLTGMSDFTVTEGTSTNGTYNGEGYDEDSERGCTRLLDGKYNYLDDDYFSMWLVKNLPSCYVEFHTAKPIIPAKYVLITSDDYLWDGDYAPKSWTIKAKLKADDAWTTIASVTDDETMKESGCIHYVFNFDNDAGNAYQYFRFDINNVRVEIEEGTPTMRISEMQLSEMQLLTTNPVANDVTISKTRNSATVSWKGVGVSYNVRLRKQGEEWHTTSTTEQTVTFADLDMNTPYECQIQSVVGSLVSDWTPLETFTIASYTLSGTNVQFFYEGSYNSIEEAIEGETVIVSLDPVSVEEDKYLTGTYSSPDGVTFTYGEQGDATFVMPAKAVTVTADVAERSDYTIDLTTVTTLEVPYDVWITLMLSEGYCSSVYDGNANEYLMYIDMNLDGTPDLQLTDDYDEATGKTTYGVKRLGGAAQVMTNGRFIVVTFPGLNHSPYSTVLVKLNDSHEEKVLPIIVPGDANGDGTITVTDIAVVVNCILQLANTGGYSSYGADANGDGDITVTDIGVIVDKILGTSGNSSNSRKMQQEVEPQ